MVQEFHMQNAPTFSSEFGRGLGQQLSNMADLTLKDKMSALQEQRKMEYAQKEYQMQQKHLEEQAAIADSIYPGLGMAHRLLGPQGLAKALAEHGDLEKVANQFAPHQQKGPSGMGSFDQLFPKRQQFDYQNQMVSMQDREAVEEQPEMPQEQAMMGKPYGMMSQEEKPAEAGLKTLDDFRRRIAPNYDKLGRTAKARVDMQAEREFNSEMKLKSFEQKKLTDVQKQQTPFLKEIRAKADAAKTLLNAADSMQKIRERGNLGISSGARALLSKPTRADRAAYDTQASQFLSYYKALFPRGFTQQEFKHIEENWMPKSSNTDERNQAIEQTFKEMAQTLVQKSELLDELRDENGNLPSNAEQKVDQLMGEKIKKLQNKFTEETPTEEEKKAFESLPKPAEFSGKTILDTKTGSKFRSNGTKWTKVS